MSQPNTAPAARSRMVEPFPQPGRRVVHAYLELHLAANGTQEQRQALGDFRRLARPWDPPSCPPDLRAEIWDWLEAVVTWLNGQYTWDTEALIPPCWPRHPHLVHEVAVVADQRRIAGESLTSDLLEDWHRYCLPAFVERVRCRLGSRCDETHQPTPGKARQRRHDADGERRGRATAYLSDVESGTPGVTSARRLQVVDVGTGELLT